MHFTLQLVLHAEEGSEQTAGEIAVLEKDCQRIEHLGLTLAEAKRILKQLQQHILQHQVMTFLAARSQCACCGASLRIKGQPTRTFRTLFGIR